jgi:ApbE superfamily uncharacterized protein (UPF0280 family)
MIRRRIQVEETNIILETDLKNHDLVNYIIKERMKLKKYINLHPEFLSSLEPVKVTGAPFIVMEMAHAADVSRVGPMAAVAGTISQLSLDYLLEKGAEYIIVDNGGDIALKVDRDVIIGLYAGNSSLSGNIGFKIKHKKTPMGVCTSSGSVGHSISFGKADSVTVFGRKASISDALATSIANKASGINENESVQMCLEWAEELREYFKGVLVVMGESAGTIGKIPKLIETDKKVVLGDLFELH